MLRTILAASAAVAAFTTPALAQQNTLDGQRPLAIAHRGASGYLPDHTLEGYAKAVEMGADFIEPDLVVTKDGVLIARHEPMLGGTTDVADRPEFASRKRKLNIDGIPTEDWFACDFTLAEIKTLRAKQPLAERDQSFNGKFLVPTFQEVIDLAKEQSQRTGRVIGIAPETKHPTFHTAMGLPIEDRLVETLEKAGWTEKTAPVIIQSFETANLKYLRGKTNVRLVQLVDGGSVDAQGKNAAEPPYVKPYDFVVTGDNRTNNDLLTAEGLKEVATYADGISPWKAYLIPTIPVDANGDGQPDDLNADGKMDERDKVAAKPTDVVRNAHAAGLFVQTWTFRSEPRRLASTYNGEPAAEYRAFFDLGVDGIFSDFPDQAVAARNKTTN